MKNWMLCSLLLLAPTLPPVGAQIQPDDQRFWFGAAVVFGAAVLTDAEVRDAFPGRREGTAGRIAAIVQPLGLARTVYLGLGGSYVGARVLSDRSWANSTLEVAAGYVAADAITSVLKGGVGRHRPDDQHGAYRFYPGLKARSGWDSFPSGHTTHAFAIAAGISAETDSPAIASAAYGTAALVGMSRVYDRAHWASDVVAGAIIGTAASRTTIHWLKRRETARTSTLAGTRIIASPGVLGVVIPFG